MSQNESETSKKPEEDIKELIFKKFQEQEYDAVYRLIKHGKFTNTEDLLKLWDEAHYKQKENLLKKPLTTLMRFRVRKRNPPPESICPGGIRPKRHLPKHATEKLKIWLHQHRLNPYPNKLEKQMLAEETGVTYNQVKTWFSNSRRLLQQRYTRPEEGEGQRHWYAGNCYLNDNKDNQCPCEDSHGSRAVESCQTAKRDVTKKMESDSYADSDGSVQREKISKDMEIKMPSKDSLFLCTPRDQAASAICSWTGECITELSNFEHKENIHNTFKDQTKDATENCDNVPNDTNLNPAKYIKENDSWDNKPLTKTPQICAEHMNNRYQNLSELGTYPKLEPLSCFSPKEKKECISYQSVSLSPLHTEGKMCTSSSDSHDSVNDNKHKRSSPVNCLSIGSPLSSTANNNNADLVSDSNFLQTGVLRDQAPVVLQYTTSLKQSHGQFGAEHSAYNLKSHHGTSEPDRICKERKLHVSGDSGYQTDGISGHRHRVDSLGGEIGTRVLLKGEMETWDTLSSTSDEFSEFDDDDDDVCYTLEPSYRPDYLKTESKSISDCSQGNNSDYYPYQNRSSYTPSSYSNDANHSSASYRNEPRFGGHWQQWANRLQILNSDLTGIANSSKGNNPRSKDDNSGSRFNFLGRSEMMCYEMATQNPNFTLAFLPGSLKSEQRCVRHGDDYKMEYGRYIGNPSQNCNEFISSTFTQNQLPFSQEGLPSSENSSVTYMGSTQYAARNCCILCGTDTSQMPCWCVLWYRRQQYFDTATNILHARKSDTNVVKQDYLNQEESSNQVNLSRTEYGSINQVHHSGAEHGSNQVHYSEAENRKTHVSVHLSGKENDNNQVHQCGTENGNNQVHPNETENESKPAQLGFYSQSSLSRNSANHIMRHLGGPHLQMTPHPSANLSGNYASTSSARRNEDTMQPVFLSNSYNQPAGHQVWWPFFPNVYNPMLTETHRSNYCFPLLTNTANFTSRLVQPSSRSTFGPVTSGYRPQDFAYGAIVPMILPSSGQQTVAQALLNLARFHPREQL